MIPRPRRMSSRQSSGIGSFDAMLSRLPAIDLIGASELFSSCPSTRISRCQASRSCCRNGTLTSLNTTSVCGSPPCRNEPRRTCHWPVPPGKAMFRTRGALPSRHAARLMSSAVRHISCSTGRPSSRSPARFTSRKLPLIVERKHRDIDLAHHRPEQRGRLERTQTLVTQRVGQRIDLEQRLAERIVAGGAARTEREVALAQCLEQVGHGLQGEHDAVPQRGRGQRPEHAQDETGGDDRLRGIAASPQQQQRRGDTRAAGRDRQEENPTVVAQLHVVPGFVGSGSAFRFGRRIHGSMP